MTILQVHNIINWITVLIAVSSSSVLTCILSYLFSLNSKKLDFKFDHKKYIIKRRIEAYERIEPFITEIYNGCYISKKDIPNLTSDTCVQSFFTPKKYFGEDIKFHNVFYNQTIRDWYWFSVELRNLFNDVSGFLGTVRDEIDLLEKNDYNLVMIAGKNFEKIKNRGLKLIIQYFKDIKKMDDIHSFIHQEDK